MENKLKMNNRKFVTIWTAVVALLVVLAIAATILMNFFSLSMEIFLGRGERVVTTDPALANADTNFYDPVDTENLDANTDRVALSIAEEGEVLLKNDGVLPLQQGASVTGI